MTFRIEHRPTGVVEPVLGPAGGMPACDPHIVPAINGAAVDP